MPLFSFITGRASGEAYMLSEPRFSLTGEANTALLHVNPSAVRSDDAGNWTGCSQGNGNLVGTHRDLSACMASSIIGRPITSQELGQYSRADVNRIFIDEFNRLGLNQLTDQDVANIVMHIKLHFGNVRLVQNALNDLGENLSVDGAMGAQTLAALKQNTKKDAAATFNAIRGRLEQSYQNANPVYRQGFLNAMKHFPPKKNSIPWRWILLAILIILFIIIILI